MLVLFSLDTSREFCFFGRGGGGGGGRGGGGGDKLFTINPFLPASHDLSVPCLLMS